MGISRANGALALLHDVIRSERLVVAGLKMAELGNQSIRKDVLGVQVPAKKLFTAMGFEHTSIDINGKDGALPIDLSVPIAKPELVDAFDIVTNFGTIEHVSGQYHAWRNVHRLAKTGGLFLHLLPAVGSFPGHCDYRYDGKFVPALAALCGYEVLRHATHDILADARVVIAVLRKTAPGFPEAADFSRAIRIDGSNS